MSDYAQTLQEQLERVHEFAWVRMKVSSERMKDRYDPPDITQHLEAGDGCTVHKRKRDSPLNYNVPGKDLTLLSRGTQIWSGLLHPTDT